MIRIEIIHARAQRCIAKSLTMPPGALIADALKLAALEQDFQDVDLANATVARPGAPVICHSPNSPHKHKVCVR